MKILVLIMALVVSGAAIAAPELKGDPDELARYLLDAKKIVIYGRQSRITKKFAKPFRRNCRAPVFQGTRSSHLDFRPLPTTVGSVISLQVMTSLTR